MVSPDDAAGLDLVWLGCDEDGLLAAFVTGGEGPIPVAALTSALGEDDLESQLLQLPVSSACRLLTDVPNSASFIELSRRGLFVFDWTDVHRAAVEATNRYELMCRPDRPLPVADLPLSLRAIARHVALKGIRFSSQSGVRIEQSA
jgi:hypothetical protein